MPDTNPPGLRFGAPLGPGARHPLLCGSVTVGAVFPPAQETGPWAWRVWVNGKSFPSEGMAADRSRAKDAAKFAFRAFLDQAGLELRRE